MVIGPKEKLHHLECDARFAANCLHSWRTTGEFSSVADGVLEFPVETWTTLMNMAIGDR